MDITERKETEEELAKYRQNLEGLVDARTHELTESNKLLKQEISERKKLEAHLRQLYQATEQSPVSIVITNTKGSIEYVNPKFCEVTGYTKEEVIGQNPRILKSGKQSEEFYRELWKTLSSGKVWKGEFHNRKKNGEPYWEAASISPIIDLAGTITHYVAVKEDVSSRKKSEDELKQAKELAEQASQAKTRFLSNMSHELRTPLNSIMGFAQLLEDEPLNRDQLESVGQIFKSGQHLLVLIDDVLDLSRIEAGRISINTENINICLLVEEVLSLVRPVAEKKGIKISSLLSSCEEYCRRFISADSTRLKQALFNLLSNAVKYNRPNGSVSISCQIIADRLLRLKVIDTGYGIPPDKLSDLFEPFNRLGAEATEIEGTGIGLTITQRLMKLMGGETGVEYSSDQGSCFYLDLPLAEFPSPEITDKKPAFSTDLKPDKGQYTILYIEDNQANIRLVESIIRRNSNHKLLTATDSKTGIDLAQKGEIDLILLDLRLPEINGYQVLKHLKTNDKTAKIPVVAVSASPFKEKPKSGFACCITKPIDIHKFMEVINSVLSKSPLQTMGLITKKED